MTLAEATTLLLIFFVKNAITGFSLLPKAKWSIREWNTRYQDQHLNEKSQKHIAPKALKMLQVKTLRDEFAMNFEWLSNEELEDEMEREVEETPLECQARLAYSYADAMMKEREK